MTTLFSTLSSDADATAFIVPDTHAATNISYQELSQICLKFQQKLANLGISPEHTIALSVPNSIEFVVALLATSFQRASTAPLNPAYKQAEFEFCLRNSDVPLILLPRGAVCENGEAVQAATRCGTAMGEIYWDGIEVNLAIMDFGKTRNRSSVELEIPIETDVAITLHTRDSTGQLRANPLTHQQLVQTTTQEISTYRLTSADRTVLIMPMYHIHGLIAGLLSPLAATSSIILPSRFSAHEFWSDFATYAATWYTAIPAMHQALLRALPSPVPKIRFVRSCSTALPVNVLKRMELVLNAPVLEGNTMPSPTASSPITSPTSPPTPRPTTGLSRTHSVLRPRTTTALQIRILSPTSSTLPPNTIGDIYILGSTLSPGYTASKHLPGFTSDGYFKTGDRGFLDEEGYLFLTSTRKRRMSVVGGVEGGLVSVEEGEGGREVKMQLGVGVREVVVDEKVEVRMERWSSGSEDSLGKEKEGLKVVRKKRSSSRGLPRLLTSCFC